MSKWIYRWNDVIWSENELPGVYRRKAGGFHVRGRATDPRTGRIREVNNTLPECRRARDASLILASKLDAIRTGASGPARSKMPSFATYAVELLDRKINEGTIRSPFTKLKWKWALESLLIPAFGPLLIDQIEPADIEAWKAKMAIKIKAKEYKPTSVNNVMAILRVICTKATVEYDLKDPLRGVADFDTRTHRTYTPESPNSIPPERISEFLDLARVRYPEHYAMIYLMLFTGLRPSSVRPLRVKGDERDVDLDRGILIIRRSHSLGQVAIDATKTARDQTIHMPDAMVKVLRWHLDQLDHENTHRQKRSPEHAEAMAKSDLLFPAPPNRWNRGGGYHSTTTLAKPFAALGKALKLAYPITPRSMRRTYQDLARAAGLRDVVTRAISGHATEEMQRLYSTVGADEMRAGLAKVISLATRKVPAKRQKRAA